MARQPEPGRDDALWSPLHSNVHNSGGFDGTSTSRHNIEEHGLIPAHAPVSVPTQGEASIASRSQGETGTLRDPNVYPNFNATVRSDQSVFLGGGQHDRGLHASASESLLLQGQARSSEGHGTFLASRVHFHEPEDAYNTELMHATGPSDTAHQNTQGLGMSEFGMSEYGAAHETRNRNRGEIANAVDFDPETNMLQTRVVKASGGQAAPKKYQQVVTGKRESFYEVRDKQKTWLGTFKSHLSEGTQRNTKQPASQGLAPQFEVAAARFANTCAVLSIFIQGLTGGMALVTLLQIYLFQVAHWGDDAVLLLRYYSPIALKMNRLYWIFIMVALGAAVSRAAWSTLVYSPQSIEEYLPEGMLDIVKALHFRLVDYVMVLLYGLAFLLNILSASVDDELEYAIARDPGFYSAPLSDGFKKRIERWHGLNAVKCIALLLAWLMVIWEWQPRVLGRILVTVADLERARKSSVLTTNARITATPAISSPRIATQPYFTPPWTPNKPVTPRMINNATFESADVTQQPSAMAGIR